MFPGYFAFVKVLNENSDVLQPPAFQPNSWGEAAT